MSRQKEGPTREETGRGGGRHGTFCLLCSGREKAKALEEAINYWDGDGPLMQIQTAKTLGFFDVRKNSKKPRHRTS